LLLSVLNHKFVAGLVPDQLVYHDRIFYSSCHCFYWSNIWRKKYFTREYGDSLRHSLGV